MKTSKGREQHPYQMPALIALTAILGAQIVWIVWQLMTAGFAFAALWRPVAFTIVFLLVAVTRGRMRVINTLGRVMIAVAFLSALWNRFDDFSEIHSLCRARAVVHAAGDRPVPGRDCDRR
jgi:uncharacterized membrane protein